MHGGSTVSRKEGIRMRKRGARKVGLVALVAVALPLSLGSVASAVATGAWVDEVIFTEVRSPTVAIELLEAGALDLYMYPIGDPELYKRLLAHPELSHFLNYHSGPREFTLNPYGPVCEDPCRLNPFAAPRIREAVNWLVDREKIVREVLHDLGVPRYTVLNPLGAEALERYPHVLADIEAYYAHDFERARAVIREEMERLGALLLDGIWHYRGEGCACWCPVELVVLIRQEDERREVGDYLADLLEDLGFIVMREVKPGGVANQIWLAGEPGDCQWHVYTGAWVQNMVRDEACMFGYFYTRRGGTAPLWQAYAPDPVFDALIDALCLPACGPSPFATMADRELLFEQALWLSMQDSARVWIAGGAGFVPFRHDVALVDHPVGYLGGSYLWPHTVHFHTDGVPQPGGTLRMGVPYLLSGPWNPVAGAFSPYFDAMINRQALGDFGTIPHPRSGLSLPQRIEWAEVYLQEGLPAERTDEWVELQFVPRIEVPLDAWADWDAVNQRFLTVAERFGTEGTTALRKSVVYYPADLYDVSLHDGSTISIADFVLSMIVLFDRAKEGSPVFDATAVPTFDAFMNCFKGVRIVSEVPLVIETYSDAWHLDAEMNVTTWFPSYGRPESPQLWSHNWPGYWHMIALGLMAEERNELAFSQAKAGTLGIDWMSYISGRSLDILQDKLYEALATGYIPYAPTLSHYITPSEALERWVYLDRWYRRTGHFWVGSGPFYLSEVDHANKTVRLARFEDYPDPGDKWLFLLPAGSMSADGTGK